MFDCNETFEHITVNTDEWSGANRSPCQLSPRPLTGRHTMRPRPKITVENAPVRVRPANYSRTCATGSRRVLPVGHVRTPSPADARRRRVCLRHCDAHKRRLVRRYVRKTHGACPANDCRAQTTVVQLPLGTNWSVPGSSSNPRAQRQKQNNLVFTVSPHGSYSK